MIAAILLLAVGVGDVVRRRVAGRAQPVIGLLVATAIIFVAGIGYARPLDIAPVATAAALVVAALWMLAVRIDETVTPPLWPAVVLIVALALAAVLTPWGAEPVSVVPGAPVVDPGLALAVLAVLVALTTTANLMTRAMLTIARGSHPSSGAHPDRRWVMRVGRRRALVVEREETAPDAAQISASTLQGGRIIGPLERLLIVALALVGAQGLIAALLAAKGIVRFPEISADRRLGSKAEEFLIGSLTSWSLAGLAVALVACASGAL
jgi:hypothetical protein